jgi:putative transcriptional regulator
MELLRNLRLSTRLLFLYEVTTTRHTRLRTIAERLGMTVQGASEYAHSLMADGLLSATGGEYRATKKGVEFLHDRLHELRDFVNRAGREMAFVETTAAVAATSIPRGAKVGLFMEAGLLVAHAGRASPSSGIAAHEASKGDIVAVRNLEGIVSLRPGRVVIVRVRSGMSGRRVTPSSSASRLLRRARTSIVAGLDVVGVVTARQLGLKPRIEFGVLPATVEAAERGMDVLLVLPEERAGEAIRAIEEANAKLEDKIPFESVTLG